VDNKAKSQHTTDLCIRPFEHTEADYQALVEVYNAAWPEYGSTLSSWKHGDNTWDSNYTFQRLLVERGGEVVAFGEYSQTPWEYKPGKYFIDCVVRPDARDQGVGSAFYDHVIAALVSHNPKKLVIHLREDKAAAVHFVERRGFQLKMRFPLSHLDMEAFDFERYVALDDKLRGQGITIHTAAELEDKDPDSARKQYELACKILEDVPSPDPITPQPFEQYEKWRSGHPNYLPQAHFVALEGERYVGYSGLWKHATDPHKLNTGLSGVLRSHRRKGICTALKVCGFRFAQQRGVRLIETENEERNPMYGLNLRLGFTPQPAWTNYAKTLR